MPARIAPPARRRQVIREPVIAIGVRSGRVQFTAGEAGSENLTIRPRRARLGKDRRQAGERVRSYQAGGALTVDPGIDPSDPTMQEQLASGAVYFDVATNTIRRRQVATPTAGTVTGTQTAAWQAQQQQLAAQAGQIAAQRTAIDAQLAYLAEQERARAADVRYQTEAERARSAQRGDILAIQAAQQDVGGITTAARTQRERAVTDYKYGIAGLPTPEEVVLPRAKQGTELPPGVRVKVQTPEEITRGEVANTEALRQNALEKYAILARQAGLTAQGSGLQAQVAGQAASRAGVAVNEANLAERQALQPPAPGLVYDEVSGTFMTSQERSKLSIERDFVFDPVNREYVERRDLMARTDTAGNIMRKDGTWVDPRSSNEFRNGVWVDPLTGNVFDQAANVWRSAEGNTFHITGPHTGAGYWTNSAGERLNSFGEVVGGSQQSLDLSGLFGAPSGGGSGAAPGGGAPLDAATLSTTLSSAGWPADQMQNALNVINLESGGNPAAAGAEGEVGLFQIHPINWSHLSQVMGMTIDANTLRDPVINARAALIILREQGWGAWTTAAGLGLR